jgi:hypothetical protein
MVCSKNQILGILGKNMRVQTNQHQMHCEAKPVLVAGYWSAFNLISDRTPEILGSTEIQV